MPGRGGPTKNFYLPLARKHVSGSQWKDQIGTDFWLQPDILMGTSVTGSNQLVDNGWATEGGAEHGVAGSGSDFRGGVITAGSPDDPGIPTHTALIASGDLLVSPPVFGGYDHMLAAAWLVGKDRNQLPNKLVLECRAAFTTASNNEPRSGFGFFEASTTTSSGTEADQVAFISSDGTNFQLATNASSTLVDVGALIGTTWKEWKMVIDYTTATTAVVRCSWFIDGVLQGSIVPVTDEAPYAFGCHVLSNVLLVGIVHIYYDWGSGVRS